MNNTQTLTLRNDYAFKKLFGTEEGLAEGEARGSRQAKLETAKILKQFGDSIQKIMQATGLSKEEVEAIHN